MSIPTGSAGRALLVLRIVAREGPLSAGALTRASGLGRTAVHRALVALIEAGMLRYGLAKRSVMLTEAARREIGQGQAAPAIVEQAAAAINVHVPAARLMCDIATLAGPELLLIDSTERAPDMGDEFIESDLAAVLLSRLPPSDVVRLIRAAGEAARPRRGLEARRQAFIGRYRLAQHRGSLWSAEAGSLCMALAGEGPPVAIRLRGGSGGGRAEAALRKVMGEIAEDAPQLFPKSFR